jgi:3'-phosphoadenosine 5'-phosphosulfate sulfotransferase (PAPS reductase)/FAD synthetase
MTRYVHPDLTTFDLIVIHTSGGKDSQTALRRALTAAREQDVMDRVAVLHLILDADPRTGAAPRVEWQQVPELAAEQARRNGVGLAADGGWVVQNTAAVRRIPARTEWAGQMHYARRSTDWYQRDEDRDQVLPADLWEDVATRRKRDESLRGWPTQFTRYCTSDWKTAVGRAFTQHLVDSLELGRPAKVLQVMGFRAQEGRERAKWPAFGVKTRASAPSKRIVWEWLPIHELSTAQVWDDIRVAGVPYHPVYDRGMSRLSCRFCVMANPADLATARRLAPDAAADVIAVETAVGDPFQARIKKTVRNKVVVAEEKIPMPLAAIQPAPGRDGFDVHWATCTVCAVPVLAEVAPGTPHACPAHAANGVWDRRDNPTSGCTELTFDDLLTELEAL